MLKKLMRSRVTIAAFCIALAAVLCFVAAPMMNSNQAQKVNIVRVTANVRQGEKIPGASLETVSVGGYNLPANLLTSTDEVAGKYATAALQTGDYVLSGKVSDTPLSAFAYLNKLDGSRQAVSVTIKTFAAGLSGKLESGDIISLIAANYGEGEETVVPQDLRYVRLLAATTPAGIDNQTATSDKKATEKEENEMPSTLTVLATPDQAKSLVQYESKGQLHAALVYRGSEDNAEKFLAKQDEYLELVKAGNGGEPVA